MKKLVTITLKVIIEFDHELDYEEDLEDILSNVDYELRFPIETPIGQNHIHLLDTQWFEHKIEDTDLEKFN